jgi:hypothetical protein
VSFILLALVFMPTLQERDEDRSGWWEYWDHVPDREAVRRGDDLDANDLPSAVLDLIRRPSSLLDFRIRRRACEADPYEEAFRLLRERLERERADGSAPAAPRP